MTRRLRASPATRAAVHHDPRPREYCPRHGTAYPKVGCEECAYEAEHRFHGPLANLPCRLTLHGTIVRVENIERVVVRITWAGFPEGTLLTVPLRLVTPLVEVKS